MATFKIRFNTEHNGSNLKWRVLIDDVEHLAEKIVVNTLTETSQDFLEDRGVIKWHVKCFSDNFKWEDKTLYINEMTKQNSYVGAYNVFIGRYQTPHKGHMSIFNEFLKNEKPILIMIRDVPTDEKNPFTPEEVKSLWEKVYADNISKGLVKIMIIPDVASVNYGRGVGYEVNEIKVDAKIASISATEIRSKIRSGDDSWKEFVDPSIQGSLHELLTR